MHLCPTCGLTVANIKDNEFSCRGGLTKQIVYRARIVGTDVYSAPGLVSLMQSWVGSGRASIMVQSSRLHLDSACATSLDTLKSPDCKGRGDSTPKPPTDSFGKPITAPQSGSSGGASLGEIGGIAVGGVIIFLLAILIVLIVVVIMWKMKSKVSMRLICITYTRLYSL